MSNSIGTTTWSFAAGYIPSAGTGREPEFTSRDELCVLNGTDDIAELRITVYHSDRDPVGPYEITVDPLRVRHVRVNNLIDPQAVPLDSIYGLVVTSNVPVVIQLSRLDSREESRGISLSSGWAG